jgi:hypothetical protein
MVVSKPEVRGPESSMQKKILSFVALALLMQVLLPCATCQARSQGEKASYPAMAPLDHYLNAGPEFRNRAGSQWQPHDRSTMQRKAIRAFHCGRVSNASQHLYFGSVRNGSWPPPPNDPEFWNPK